MSLLESAMEDCVTLIKISEDDGEGGFIETWKNGLSFKASFDFQSSMQAKIGEKQGVTGLWNIYVPKDTTLEFHNVFKRLKDGQIFRITSKDDKKTPNGAGLNLRLVSAEEWELTE